MNRHDKKEIKKLKEFRNFIKWYRTLTKEEAEKWILQRWQDPITERKEEWDTLNISKN